MLELLRRTPDGTNRIANRGPMRFLLLCVATCPATALLSPVPVRASPIVHSRSSMIVAQQQQLPPGWYTTVDPQSGRTYYCDERSGQCQWDPPQMQSGAEQQPSESELSALRRLAANDRSAEATYRRGEATRDSSADAFATNAEGTKYCKYDAIRAQLAASRSRSYEQGRKGCCGKAADYLSQGKSGPPPGSPWARKS